MAFDRLRWRGLFGQNTIFVLNALTEPKSAKELAALMSCSIRTMKDKYLDKMLIAEVVSMTIPDKPTSRNQKYKLLSE